MTSTKPRAVPSLRCILYTAWTRYSCHSRSDLISLVTISIRMPFITAFTLRSSSSALEGGGLTFGGSKGLESATFVIILTPLTVASLLEATVLEAVTFLEVIKESKSLSSLSEPLVVESELSDPSSDDIALEERLLLLHIDGHGD
ncbi:hypothetical protein EVAR_38034_1 [Eumeta japonica]|uniref:Uncharacterized protein n=1 Tax=Eumeta variegata TaxID=151549 RepID=A0A4C1W8N8_EUMVA|nr:hypothetical protein EVAR_38034_1 [Eumeta japonica]